MEETELVIVGGGIHGVGVAQAAVAAGYQVLLLEKTALAAGTSSCSTKLIHGGLRYLESGQIHLVRKNLRERELLLKLAPNLIHRQTFYIPLYDNSSRNPLSVRFGLWTYDLLTGFSKAPLSACLSRSDWSNLPGLQTRGLKAVFSYSDAQTDDAALTRAVMHSACQLGAELCCPARFTSAEIFEDHCRVGYQVGDVVKNIKCLAIVNAMGAWGISMGDRTTPPLPDYPFECIEGTHIECPDNGLTAAYYVESATDHRGVFILPWKDRTLIGTTETPYSGDPDKLIPSQASIDYLQSIYQHYFPDHDARVLNAWAGLRVLPQASSSPFNRPRETVISVNDPKNPRFVSILGGKLTGYRLTAARVIDQLQGVLPLRTAIADTAQLKLTRVEGKLQPD
ncbi:FAD-dependent oxidoreductase [Amphritea pacifica]|uniref:FAD-dependent oxidoreductase n=1 Tax=Amphritea pacifica TaxID=2811233 RepID=A0ABS2W9Z0_9GAMM|nr:FAD-dependent oxidoreductase [Amphritea pacifica]MBN0988529.1 FAD-dependent oxidoreductase [Amphritea pacifica]